MSTRAAEDGAGLEDELVAMLHVDHVSTIESALLQQIHGALDCMQEALDEMSLEDAAPGDVVKLVCNLDGAHAAVHALEGLRLAIPRERLNITLRKREQVEGIPDHPTSRCAPAGPERPANVVDFQEWLNRATANPIVERAPEDASLRVAVWRCPGCGLMLTNTDSEAIDWATYVPGAQFRDCCPACAAKNGPEAS